MTTQSGFSQHLQSARDRAGKPDPEHPHPSPGLPAHPPILKGVLGEAGPRSSPAFVHLLCCEEHSSPCQAAQGLPAPSSAKGLLWGLLGAAQVSIPSSAGLAEQQNPPAPPAREKPLTLSETALQLQQLGISAWKSGMEMPFITLVSLSIPMKSGL